MAYRSPDQAPKPCDDLLYRDRRLLAVNARLKGLHEISAFVAGRSAEGAAIAGTPRDRLRRGHVQPVEVVVAAAHQPRPIPRIYQGSPLQLASIAEDRTLSLWPSAGLRVLKRAPPLSYKPKSAATGASRPRSTGGAGRKERNGLLRRKPGRPRKSPAEAESEKQLRSMKVRADSPRLTTGRASLLTVMGRYVRLVQLEQAAALDGASLLELQKLMYFLQENPGHTRRGDPQTNRNGRGTRPAMTVNDRLTC